MKTQPQWTGGRVSDYIRTYGNISRPPNEFDECDDRQFYRLQRHRVLQQTQRNSLAHWPDVRDCFTDGLRAARRTGDHRRDHVSDKECQDLLRRALDIGREFVGIGAAMDLVESAAVYVLQVFHDAKYMKSTPGVTAQQVHELVTMFGEEEVNTQLVNGAYECAKTLLDLMDTEDRERLFMPFRSRPQFNGRRSLDGYNVANNGGTGDDIYDPLARYKDVEEWSDYKYKDLDIDPFKERYTFEEMCAIVPRMPFTRAADRSAAERNDKPKGYELSFQYKNTANECQQKSQMASQGSVKKPVKYVKYSEYMSANTTANTAATQRESDVYDVEWLNRELNKYIDNYFQKNSEQFYMNIETLADTVMDWVQSDGKSDEELAGDLHSLLGDDCLPLIEKLVKYRQRVKESYKQVYCDQMGGSADTTANTDQSHGPRGWSQLTRDKALAVHVPRERGPAIAPSVVVQTSEEKNLKKQMRKLEKKLNKELYREGEEQVSAGGVVTIEDIERMKQQREAQLYAAMMGPLFREGGPAVEVLDKADYPYVFDALQETKSTAAFISGAKMTLPLGFERKDRRLWEEITIPAPPPPPDTVIADYKLIDVEALDAFGRAAFKGVKQLNRIQSIVFKTADTTNENMLICAPTGAGKTNVAMLTIVAQIRANSPTGSINDIHLDQFKIVYIAPMKALAAEMTENFGKRLAPFGMRVRELTGDMQLSKSEIMATQMLVTTPEKWDVVTRKAKGDVQLLQLVRLVIIDEVHLLQSDRGPVLEALVARTKRYIESAQMMIRMVGLSATLPNYRDVAEFLRVNPRAGLFMFDNRFRPVPLTQTFIGCKATQTMQQMRDMDDVCYEKVREEVSKGHQVMVFVHARNATYRTATNLLDRARKSESMSVFKCETDKMVDSAREIRRARHKGLQELFEAGFAIHHAGMLRMDRNLVEKLFRAGVIRVLVCTATLAWGVNLPAHSVVIKGTEMYDSSHGNFVDISMLDVMQIFGRAGRPQYDTEGHGTIITAHNKLRHYLSLLTNQFPIESQFKKYLTDNMNAEIVSGTITTIDEAIDWIRDTYLYIRMRKNPQCYGIGEADLRHDRDLYEYRRRLVTESAEDLDRAKMVRFSPEAGTLDPTDLGRTASHYYIKYDTIMKFNELISDMMDERAIFAMIATAQEFDQLKSREDEFEELEDLLRHECQLGVPGGVENKNGKVNILMQSQLSRAKIDSFSLVSDTMFVMQNVNRIARGLFDYVVKKGWALLAEHLLRLSLMFERRQWAYETPLRQFGNEISFEVMSKIERLKPPLTIALIKEMTADDLGRLVRHTSYGSILKRLADTLPSVAVEACIKPITRTVLMVEAMIKPTFRWDDRHHGKVCESFWLWLSDIDSNHIYHSELFKLSKRQVIHAETQKVTFNIPLLDPDSLPSQYIIHCGFDRWLGCELNVSLPCRQLILPEKFVPYTRLLDLDPLPVTALNNPLYESIYRFTHFNPIQTQIFHTLYHTDGNVLVGAPTGSGKTICAEIAMFRTFNTRPAAKVVYIAPLKALVRERVDDWKQKIEQQMGRHVVELTGDVTPDVRAIMSADVIVTTPEKWDGISRSWQQRKYVRDVALIVIDEIHLLGEDRGPVLEVIVSRTNFITQNSRQRIRIVGLSTAIANAQDLANWLDIKRVGLYNFKPSVRPVPIEVHVAGFPGKNYCPRMALMNKPAYRAILQHSPVKPVLIFVSSRRQTRLTAFDLMTCLAADGDNDRFLHMDRQAMTALVQNVRDSSLRTTLDFGIGLHHAGLHERDRALVEELFSNQKIQVLVSTATLAWGVNLPAHAVIIKGTEYFDGKKHRYVDFPITDVLQMMGRAGRPQFDTTGVAVVLVQDTKKEFYKKFLYEPFPVESQLLSVITDHMNAEIVSGTVHTRQEAVEYLNWTYLFRRVLKNPNYYGLESVEPDDVNRFLSKVIDNSLNTLCADLCLTIDETDERTLTATPLGRIASFYYIHHSTVRSFHEAFGDPYAEPDFGAVLDTLCNAYEYNELPVRHNEDILNATLATTCPIKLSRHPMDSPHTKANLLLQAHITRLSLPNTDYFTDLKSVLDQAIRVTQAMIDVAALAGALPAVLRIVTLLQMIVQCRWHYDNPVLTLPDISAQTAAALPQELRSLPLLVRTALSQGFQALQRLLKPHLRDQSALKTLYETLVKLPLIDVALSVVKTQSSGAESSDAPTEKNECIPVPMDAVFGPTHRQQPIRVERDTEYALVCDFQRLHTRGGGGQRAGRSSGVRAVAPKFPKPKDENWFAILGDTERRELLALRRVGAIAGKTQHTLTFTTPAEAPVGPLIYTFYLVSDCYLHLDQQYTVCLSVQ